MKTDELIEELEYAAVQAVISGCPLNRLNSAKEALRTAIKELNKDARRYQWLMNNTKGFAPCVWSTEDGCSESYYSVNQVQIDAAMEKSE